MFAPHSFTLPRSAADARSKHEAEARAVLGYHPVTEGTTWRQAPVVTGGSLETWIVTKARRGIFLGARTVATVELLWDHSVMTWRGAKSEHFPPLAPHVTCLDNQPALPPGPRRPWRHTIADAFEAVGLVQDDAGRLCDVLLPVWQALRRDGSTRDARAILRLIALLQSLTGDCESLAGEG